MAFDFGSAFPVSLGTDENSVKRTFSCDYFRVQVSWFGTLTIIPVQQEATNGNTAVTPQGANVGGFRPRRPPPGSPTSPPRGSYDHLRPDITSSFQHQFSDDVSAALQGSWGNMAQELASMSGATSTSRTSGTVARRVANCISVSGSRNILGGAATVTATSPTGEDLFRAYFAIIDFVLNGNALVEMLQRGWGSQLRGLAMSRIQTGQSAVQIGRIDGSITLRLRFGLTARGITWALSAAPFLVVNAAANVGVLWLFGQIIENAQQAGNRQAALTNFCVGYIRRAFDMGPSSNYHRTTEQGYAAADREISLFSLIDVRNKIIREVGVGRQSIMLHVGDNAVVLSTSLDRWLTETRESGSIPLHFVDSSSMRRVREVDHAAALTMNR